jgi:hypothetical protein
MNTLERRLERLERRTDIKSGPRIIYLTQNLEHDEPEESPYLVKLSSDLWANVFGAPLSEAEIRQLRENYEKEHRDDLKPEN